jgi:cation diffusion facilitator family transporter
MNVKERVALGSIAASAGLAAAKAIVGLLTGSLAILSEAGHSLIDLSATVLTYFAVRLSGKPADKEHQYGHGKVESVTALAETALLFLLSVIVIWEAARRLIGAQAHAVEATVAAFAIIACSIVVDFFRARTLRRVATETSSEALEADALHFGSDMWSSVAVLVGLGGVALGYAWADATAAIVVAVFICIAGWRLGRRTIDTLTDTAAIKDRLTRAVRAELPHAEVTITTEPRALDDETVRERVMMIARNRGLAIHHVAVQAIAGRLAISVDLEVEGAMALNAAHEVASGLEEAMREELGPDVEVETHIEPLPADVLPGRDASAARITEVREALSALAAEIAALGEVHDVRVRETKDGEIVNFHCQVDPALSVGAVHDMVDALERRLRRRFPTIQRVIGHAEPRQ